MGALRSSAVSKDRARCRAVQSPKSCLRWARCEAVQSPKIGRAAEQCSLRRVVYDGRAAKQCSLQRSGALQSSAVSEGLFTMGALYNLSSIVVSKPR
jgi:hypothetical protein